MCAGGTVYAIIPPVASSKAASISKMATRSAVWACGSIPLVEGLAATRDGPMCSRRCKPAQRIPSKAVRVDWTDAWDPKLLQALGALLIACAQLEYQVYIVAKRKDGRGLLHWVLANPEQFFSRYCCWLEQHCRSDRQLMRLVGRARRLWTQRNGYVHALWALRRGRPVAESSRTLAFRSRASSSWCGRCRRSGMISRGSSPA
ncbi:MAG: hypothetical protein K0S81_3498 [Rhodospirillales bacterium]|jgi:hypothetical protein|nr:hypothetical protein [Rhodospirillales bacterium]